MSEHFSLNYVSCTPLILLYARVMRVVLSTSSGVHQSRNSEPVQLETVANNIIIIIIIYF